MTTRPVTIPAQIRAGRALLGWTQVQLAQAAGVSVSTVKAFETGRAGKELAAAGPMRAALEREGIEFLSGNKDDGPGVQLAGAPPIQKRS